MGIRFSDEFVRILTRARDEALRTGWHNITPDHLMLGILRDKDCEAYDMLREAGVDTSDLKDRIDDVLFREEAIPWSEIDSIRMSDKAASCLNLTVFEAVNGNSDEVTTAHILLALTNTAGSLSASFLASMGITHRTLASMAAAGGTQSTSAMPPVEDIADELAILLSSLPSGAGICS